MDKSIHEIQLVNADFTGSMFKLPARKESRSIPVVILGLLWWSYTEVKAAVQVVKILSGFGCAVVCPVILFLLIYPIEFWMSLVVVMQTVFFGDLVCVLYICWELLNFGHHLTSVCCHIGVATVLWIKYFWV